MICPNHDGAFDCTPFCEICQGNQEFTPKPFTDLELTGKPLLGLRLDCVYVIAEFLERDYGLLRGLQDDTTTALRELQKELTNIITKRESKNGF